MSEIKSLIIVPFDAAGKRVQDTIKRALREMGVEPLFVDEIVEPGAAWTNTINDAIRESDFIFIDLSRQSPYAIYELGIAHGLRKPTFLLLSTEAKSGLPSYLAGYQYIAYDPDNLKGLFQQVQRVARFIVKKGDD